jgi:hypothetical protein
MSTWHTSGWFLAPSENSEFQHFTKTPTSLSHTESIECSIPAGLFALCKNAFMQITAKFFHGRTVCHDNFQNSIFDSPCSAALSDLRTYDATAILHSELPLRTDWPIPCDESGFSARTSATMVMKDLRQT